jgi:hypothetical protein
MLAGRFSWLVVLVDAALFAFYGFLVFAVVQYYWRRRHQPDGEER